MFLKKALFLQAVAQGTQWPQGLSTFKMWNNSLFLPAFLIARRTLVYIMLQPTAP